MGMKLMCPNFDEGSLEVALEESARRERRFGGVREPTSQVAPASIGGVR